MGFFFKKNFFSSFRDGNPIFGKNKELLKEYCILVNEILPSLNDGRFCNQLKCKYCWKFSVNCNACKRDKYLKCHRFNKSKDVLINSGDFFISNYDWDFLHDYFKVNDLTNYFVQMDINQIVKEKNSVGVAKFGNNKLESPLLKEGKKIFYFKTKNYRHYCILI